MPLPAQTGVLRQALREGLASPLRVVGYDGKQSSGETYSSRVLRHFFDPYLPEGCQHVTCRDVLTLALARLEQHAGWAERVEDHPGSRELAQRLFGEDPADVAADCNEDVLKYKNFKAFCGSVEVLAG